MARREGGVRFSSRSYSCWLNIVKEVSVLQAKGVNVMNYVRLKLGNGESTSFWEDKWINGGVLKDVFPRLYALEMCKKVSVSLKLKDSSLETSFRRKVRGAEQSQLDILSDMVRSWSLCYVESVYLVFEGSGDFSVAIFRKVIGPINFYFSSRMLSSKTRWVQIRAYKVNISLGKVKMEALPVRHSILSARGVWLDWLGSLRLPAKLKLMLEACFICGLEAKVRSVGTNGLRILI
ncbi:hypothetical protein Tco_0887137 [Tanacetum coccineum]